MGNRLLTGVLAALLGALCSWGCSAESEEGPDETLPVALEVCKFAGEVACGYDETGKNDALLVCEVTQEHGRVWMVKESCPAGCKQGACLPLPADAMPEDFTSGDVAEDHKDLGPICLPDCDGKKCGDDGCDGHCGLCPADHKCGEDFTCFLHCEPKCAGKQCGDDGCSGSCGDCPFGMACVDGLCACKPKCNNKDCGPDGCGGECGKCPESTQCSPFGKCEGLCVPDCEGKACGDNGCQGECGTCTPGLYCSPEGQCTNQCFPACDGKQCGPDGCFGYCGFCPCLDCPPELTECNPDGLCTAPAVGTGCYTLLVCLADCLSGDVACQTGCFDDATLSAQELYDDLVDCVIAECGPTPSDACVQDALMGFCSGIYDECVFDQ